MEVKEGEEKCNFEKNEGTEDFPSVDGSERKSRERREEHKRRG